MAQKLVTRDQGPPQSILGGLAVKILLVLVPLLIGLGAGYAHLQVRQQIRAQETVAQLGVGVEATVESVEIRSQPIKSDGKSKSGAVRDVCQAAFRYSPPGGKAIVTKRLLAAPKEICKRYKAGDKTRAWVVPADNRIFMLEGDRISPWWSWASLFLFMAFCGFAIVMFRRVLGITRRTARHNGRKS